MNSMLGQFRMFPQSASTMAPRTDHLFFFLIGVAVFFCSLIFILILYFSIRYRRRDDNLRAKSQPTRTLPYELTWTVIPLIVSLTAFAWGADLYIDHARPPSNARNVFVLGKQWMWRIQHPEGAKEINRLHVAKGRPVRLTLTSEDVIHSFYVPAFRTKQDAVPGRYSTVWFTPTKTGTFDLYCAEYCGTNHAKMIGKVIVMEPAEMQTWLEGGPQLSLAEQGGQIFERLACSTCHKQFKGEVAPSLNGLPGSQVKLGSGVTITADDTYIRDSILNPANRVVAGYQPNMPQYGDQIDEEDVIALIAYIKSLPTTRSGNE